MSQLGPVVERADERLYTDNASDDSTADPAESWPAPGPREISADDDVWRTVLAAAMALGRKHDLGILIESEADARVWLNDVAIVAARPDGLASQTAAVQIAWGIVIGHVVLEAPAFETGEIVESEGQAEQWIRERFRPSLIARPLRVVGNASMEATG